jgi:hypothetical protein
LGIIPKEKIEQIPISVSPPKDKISIDSSNGTGDSVEVFVSKINITGFDNYKGMSNNTVASGSNEFNDSANITMFVTSSKSTTGELSNLTSLFSTKNFIMESTTNQSSNYNAGEVIKTYNTTLNINTS